MKHCLLILLWLSLPAFIYAQKKATKTVYTEDIDNFWTAYDSAKTITDTTKQVEIIQTLYIDKGTEGLHAFMKARDYDARLWVSLINKYPKFWNSIRPNTMKVKAMVPEIENGVTRLKELYPDMKPARMFFTIGALRSGGTTTDDMVLVGAEIAAADKNTDASELGNWLKGVFKQGDINNVIGLNVHEYVHTQQKNGAEGLLAQCITEGAADFIAEMVTGKKNNGPYMLYGREHEAELKEKFKAEMYAANTGNWLYNGSSTDHADLGYFMGYKICNAYYQQATNKKQAIKDIIELNYADESRVDNFLTVSKYYTEPINKQELLAKYEANRPYVINLNPDLNNQKMVSDTLSTLTINFSEPMGKGVSINIGKGGREHFPITKVIGFSADKKSFKVSLAMKPGIAYDFVITGNGFKSQIGYPLKEYTVSFETK